MLLELLEAVPRRVLEAAAVEVAIDGLALGLLGRDQRVDVGEQQLDRLGGVGLGVPDQADGSALDPAGDVRAGQRLAVDVDDASAVVGTVAVPLSNGSPARLSER